MICSDYYEKCYNCAMDQHDEILHSTINFDILIKGGDNEQITAKD